jgi:excisionase family DNA binding protein
MDSSTTPSLSNDAYRPAAAARRLGIGRTKLYELLASGDLGSIRVGRARLIPSRAIDAFLEHQLTTQMSGGPRSTGSTR